MYNNIKQRNNAHNEMITDNYIMNLDLECDSACLHKFARKRASRCNLPLLHVVDLVHVVTITVELDLKSLR